MGDWRDLGSNHWRHDDETYEVVFRPVLVQWRTLERRPKARSPNCVS